MTNKIYENIKEFIKKNYKIIIVYILIVCLFLIHLPYYISYPGGLIDTSKKIKTNNNFKLKGSLNMAYVSEIHATIPTYLFSLINKDWDSEKEKDIVSGDESVEDMEYRNKMLLKESNKIASLVAYKNSNVKYSIKNNKVYVTYIDPLAKTNLKVKDQIIKIDGNKVTDKNYLFQYIKSKNINDEVSLTVLKGKKEVNKKAKLINVDGEAKIGALVTETFDISSNKDIKYTFDDAESGPSGGLMLSLTIYSNINQKDITKGKKIAGTGTIDINGFIGPISGVKYKLIGAVNNKADVFLVPKGENYKEAKKLKDERGYNIDIIEVETFEQALKYLS